MPFRSLAYAAIAMALMASAPAAGQETPDAARVARLEARTSAAESIRAVKRLQHSYGHYLQAGMWDDLGALFTAGATAEFGAGTVSGREAIQAHFMAQAGRAEPGLAAGQLNARLQLQPIVTMDPDGATVRGAWHEVAMLGRYGESASWLGGVYENEYAREDGVWKISRIRYFEQYRGAYEDYGHVAPPAWNIPYHFEAAHVGAPIPADLPAAPAGGDPAALAADLAARVQRMADETAVQNLQHAWGYYMDRKLFDDAADLFAEDGSFETADGGAYVGRARIRAALDALYGAPLQRGELFDHILLQTVVTVAADGAHAAARTTQLSQLGMNGQWARWELGTYENSFLKEDGVWKLEAVRYFPLMATDYDLGWGADARPAPGVSAALAPDRAPAGGYAVYPAAQYVGFSFANPAEAKAAADAPPAIAAEDMSAALDAAEAGLHAAIAVDATENLMSSYGYYIDESDWDAMADTFGSTGSKELTGVGYYVGAERIRTALNLRGPRGGRTANFFTIHQLAQPVIHVSADGTKANARMRLFQGGGNADGSSGSWIGGVYENTAIFENGEWKFGRQDLTHTFSASYRNGWARVGPEFRAQSAAPAPTTPAPAPTRDTPGGGITQGLGGARAGASWAQDFPPDGPIRARQYTFPEIVLPAFHYANPVSGRPPAELLE